MTGDKYAGFWKRFTATLIDAAILAIVAVSCQFLEFYIGVALGLDKPFDIHALIANNPGLVLYAYSRGLFAASGSLDLFINLVMAIYNPKLLVVGYLLFVLAFNCLYYGLMESSSLQGTLGKVLLKISVTDLDGQRISFQKAILRYFSKIVSCLTLFFGFIMAGFTQYKQALHDKIAGCIVVNSQKELATIVKEADMTVYAKPTEVLARLQAASTKQFLVETTGSTFSIVIRQPIFSITSLYGTAEELDEKRTRIKIRTSCEKWPRNLIGSIVIAYFLSLFLLGLKLILLSLILCPLIIVYLHRLNVDDQRIKLLRFLNDMFLDIVSSSCI